ncbi:hypothetical protein T310_0080 [Rasamsonia emersonii CBS 393.64]|uniref:Uncharacterized protein n=1 Tax=Rasamsonia emersonii (strain ATCC 16479 / CBS 393.64 / IMI 116815) TaxID=1408163 RepID=A0A0F4Z5U1_RASE3|nr:hypothetical protein T310_0080 [Rasamsonia emersonii CBS 393.64]KKA25877.1 hypothetical protein T310_0080 [Rasamsonia emersonii CBS 393.64]
MTTDCENLDIQYVALYWTVPSKPSLAVWRETVMVCGPRLDVKTAPILCLTGTEYAGTEYRLCDRGEPLRRLEAVPSPDSKGVIVLGLANMQVY